MRLGRGSGAGGLAAPRAVQRFRGNNICHLRPLLGLRSRELQEALAAAGGSWRIDESNLSARYLRNRMRSDILPVWEDAMGRDAVAGSALSRRLLDEDDEALATWLEEIDPFDDQGRLNLRTLQGRPMALWRRALHRWLHQQRDVGDLSRGGFENLLALAHDGATRRFSLGKAGFVRIRRGWLFFEQPSDR